MKRSKQFSVLKPNDPIILGKIGSLYGTQGWLRVFSFTENPISIFAYQPLFVKINGEWEQILLERWKRHNKHLILKIAKIVNLETTKSIIINRETAKSMVQCEIIVDSSHLIPLKCSDYYWKDLIGCKVFTIDGYQLGQVTNLMETGSNDVLVIKTNLKSRLRFGIQEYLIPFLEGTVIKNVNLADRVIKIEWDLEYNI